MSFNYVITSADWGRIAPELVLVAVALVLMLIDLLLPHAGERSKESGPANYVILPVVALLGVIGGLAATITLFLIGDHQNAFYGMVGSDDGSLYAYLIILSASGLGILLSPAYLKRLNLVHQGEYYALILFSTVGMMFMAAATSFITVFLGIEMLSLALYILCAYIAQRKSSQEAGMKYFLLSSFASAFLLYGIALTYGSTGNTSFTGVHAAVTKLGSNHSPTLLLIAMGLLSVGFAFKISAIPFQAWTPDVYQGAPAPVTAFMSVGTKAAALIAFARVFAVVLLPVQADWLPVVWVITVVTIIGGNILALVQSNLKRMLAYSSIAHAGYLLIGITVGGQAGVAAILFYLLCYTFLNLGAFGVVSVLERLDNTGTDSSDLRGLWYRRPVLAGMLAFFLLSLAGFPPMAGFAAKYYLFYTALLGNELPLLIIGVLASVLGIYYYLRFIATMFMERVDTVPEAVAPVTAPATPSPSRRTAERTGVATATRTGGLTRAGGATATAVKPSMPRAARAPMSVGAASEPDSAGRLIWFTWISLAISALGTFAIGTIFPFWLIDLAQQAASMMMK